MKKIKGKSTIPFLTISVVILLTLAIMVAMLVTTSITAFYEQMNLDGEILAGNYTVKYGDALNNLLDRKLLELNLLAENAKTKTSVEDFKKLLQDKENMGTDLENSENGTDFHICCYYKDDKFYDSHQEVQPANPQIDAYYKSKTSGVTGIVSPDKNPNEFIAVCVYNQSAFCDMIVGYIPLLNFNRYLEKEYVKLEDLPQYKISMICRSNGDIIGNFVQTDGEIKFTTIIEDKIILNSNENIVQLINDYSVDKITDTTLKQKVTDGRFLSKVFNISSKKYVLSVISPKNSNGNLLLANVYDSANVLFVQNNFIAIIIMSIVMLAVIVIILVIIGVRYRKAWVKKVEDSENYEVLTGCNTFKMFKNQTTEFLKINKSSSYAIVYLTLTQFDILYENYGESVANQIISFCGKIIAKCINSQESYGHISDGKFVICIQYIDRTDLDNRLDVIYALIHNYNRFEKVDYTLSFTVGVYLVGKSEKTNIDMFISNAIVAERSTGISRSKFYTIYDEQIDEARQREREIELRKEQALQNKEFYIYYQPKLNLHTNSIAGAEALIRWYYPETGTVYLPSKFLPIFELDGFIEKLDKYVYLGVLEFMKGMVDRGYKVCPISVNVSRFTALQPDFLNFYIENKKKYNIGDGFIYIEFTESFAFDNNDKLKTIVLKLRENGIKCSIDDFGVGYSSYSILKELPMDEIKLDALFMRNGYSKERDEITLKSIMKLGRDLGMSVTQEGVENSLERDRLRDYGCDVIQGYCYSKPLSEKDFESFVIKELGKQIKDK